jgi:hypothetical protein
MEGFQSNAFAQCQNKVFVHIVYQKDEDFAETGVCCDPARAFSGQGPPIGRPFKAIGKLRNEGAMCSVIVAMISPDPIAINPIKRRDVACDKKGATSASKKHNDLTTVTCSASRARIDLWPLSSDSRWKTLAVDQRRRRC